LEVHIVVDNYATHKHLRVRRWFAARPRFHVHFTPTDASGLNQVESGSIASRNKLFAGEPLAATRKWFKKIDHYVQNANRHAQAFVWTAIGFNLR
jgi:putative transposase